MAQGCRPRGPGGAALRARRTIAAALVVTVTVLAAAWAGGPAAASAADPTSTIGPAPAADGSSTSAPAGATGADTTASSTSSTAPPPTTPSGDGPAADPPPTDDPTPTAPTDPTGAPPNPDDPAGDQPPGEDPEPLDPLAGEGPGEEAPGIDPDLPPPDTYGGQEPYTAPEVLWSSVAEAERKLNRAIELRREAVADVRALRLRQKHLDLQRQDLDDQSQATIEELGAAQDRYRGRAVSDYRLFAAGLGPEPSGIVRPTDLEQVMERRRGARLAEAALGVGSADLARLDDLRQSLDGEARTLLDRLRLVADYQVEAIAAVADTDDEIEQATIEFEAFRAGSEIFITGVVFPIGGPHDLPLIDSFGFPRMTGTPDEHWHEGIDLFAPRGTPLVAAERGLITRIGSGRLGGLKLWLVGESGTEWYYAHLDSFAPGLSDGQVVEAGDLVGYVGNTGNAVGTPPHLHLQMHPDGGRPVNPYPLLKTVSDLDQAAIADGTHRGYRHDPVVAGRIAVATRPDGGSTD